MKKFFLYAAAVALFMCSCTPSGPMKVTVTNSLDLDRKGEMVEVSMENIANRLNLSDTTQFIILNENSEQVPYQLTHDGKVIFPASVKAKAATTYTIEIGSPDEKLFNISAWGRKYPERVDDVAWENDLMAFRTYGPALQAKGERAFGYDIWLKSVPDMVVEDRYAMELNPETLAAIDSLNKVDRAAANALRAATSYHVDHGNGLDCYKVGPTLGGGTAALMVDDAILYPYCYVGEPEILDNGPLRFTVKLTYSPFAVKDDANVVETRTISLDKGSQLNKTTVSYANLTKATPIVTGIVIHPENPEAYTTNTEAGYMTYTDLTEDMHNGNGEIYVGAAFPNPVKEVKPVLFSEKESKELRGNATGHVLAISDYQPGTEYTYYWGGGWSKYGFSNADAWNKYMADYAQKVRTPLKVSVK